MIRPATVMGREVAPGTPLLVQGRLHMIRGQLHPCKPQIGRK